MSCGTLPPLTIIEVRCPLLYVRDSVGFDHYYPTLLLATVEVRTRLKNWCRSHTTEWYDGGAGTETLDFEVQRSKRLGPTVYTK